MLFVVGLLVVFCGMALLIPRPAAPKPLRLLDDAQGLTPPSGCAARSVTPRVVCPAGFAASS